MNSSKAASALVLLIGLCAAKVPAWAEEQSQRAELLIFASGEARAFGDGTPAVDDDNLLLSADLLGNWTSGRWHALGELLLTTQEQDFERLQFGWEPVPDTFLWVGRFHQPGSVWNTREHHGQYLQPSISRPSIEDWEDLGGVLPQHVAGLLFETRDPIGARHGFNLSAAAGIAPQLRDGELEPVKVHEPRGNGNLLSYSVQLAWLPEFTGDDAVGLVVSHNELEFEPSPRPDGSSHVDLSVLGFFVDLERGPWQWTSTAYSVKARFAGAPSAPEDRFLAGYVQLQRRLNSRLTVLARVEATQGTGDSAYLALFPAFVKQRRVADLRWDFAQRQALSLEIADSDTSQGNFREVRIQWSAVLP